MANCPQCNTPTVQGAAFCDNCGASLAGAAMRPPAPAPVAGGPVCAQCGKPVIPGEAFCDNCGAAITAAPAPVAPAPRPVTPMPQPIAPPPVAPAPVPAAGGMIRCGSCGSNVPAGQAFCDNCGASMSAQASVAPPPPVQPAMRPRLVAASGVQFDLTGKNQAIIGREDPVSGVFPDVDLTPHGGEAGGVGRRHAKLSFNGYQWTVEDLNSVNYTFVNNQKLNPGVPQPLKNGDQVRLGRVVLTFQTM